MKLIEFFDPSNDKHLEWFNKCEADWPKEAKIAFLENDVQTGNLFEEGIMVMAKIAHYYMKSVLCEDFVCPPAFKGMKGF